MRGKNRLKLMRYSVMPNLFRHPLLSSIKAMRGWRNDSAMTILFSLFLSSCSYFNSSHLINGSPAPEITLPDRDGTSFTLSSQRGNLVLLEFWASWCKPCREENPKIVSLYNKYKDTAFQKATGLKVISISLDTDKEKWLDAVQQDNLIWEHHVSDLLGWKSIVVDSYGVSSIPSSFLVDQNGIIIGKNLKPRDLDKLLTSLAKQ